MKKLIALILIVVVYIGSAYTISYSAESALNNYAAQIGTISGYSAELSDFRHGLLSSTAHFRVTADSDILLADLPAEQRQAMQPLVAGMEEGLPFSVDIHQGPLVFHNGLYAGLFKAEFTLTEEAEWARSLRSELQRDSIMDNELRLGFTGTGRGYMRMDPLRQGGQFFGGLQIDYELAGFGQRYTARGELSPSEFQGDEARFRLGLTTFSAAGELSDDFINDGDLSLHVTSFQAEESGRTLLDLRDLLVEAEAFIDPDNEERFSSNYRLDVERLDGAELDPPVTGIHLDLGLLNLDRAAFNDFYEASVNSASMNDPFAAQMLVMNTAAGLLKGEPELRIRTLSFEQGPDINLLISGALSIAGNVADPAALQNPFMLMNQLKLDLDLEFSRGFFTMVSESYVDGQLAGMGDMSPQFIEQMRNQQLMQHNAVLQQLVQAGMIRLEDDQYAVELGMSDGQFTVNGNPMPLPF